MFWVLAWQHPHFTPKFPSHPRPKIMAKPSPAILASKLKSRSRRARKDPLPRIRHEALKLHPSSRLRRYAAASLKLDPTNTRAIIQRVKQNRVALKMASSLKGKALLAVDSSQKAKFSLLNQSVSLELDTYLKSISPEARNSGFAKSLASELAEFRLKKY